MSEFQSLNDEAGQIWDANADFWDSRMVEGNAFHKQLVEPSQLRLLDLKPGYLSAARKRVEGDDRPGGAPRID